MWAVLRTSTYVESGQWAAVRRASATGVAWSYSPSRTSTGMCGRGPAGNAGSGTGGAGHSRHPCTSWSSSSDASHTRFANGPKTSCGSRATARASWRRRCTGDAETSQTVG